MTGLLMLSILLRWRRALVAMALCATVGAAAAAIDEADLLPVDQAFRMTAKATSADRITLDLVIADGYYLYRHRTRVVAVGDAKIGEIDLPHGEAHVDEFFGRVETFRKRLTGSVPVMSAPGGTAVVKVSYQGCADAGVCYPPQSRTLTVAMPGGSASGANANLVDAPASSAASGLDALKRTLGGASAPPAGLQADAAPLPEAQAFGFDAIADGGNALLLRFTPASGYYLYRDKTTLSLTADGIRLGTPRWPQGRQYRDEHFGDVVVYFDQVELAVPLQRTSTAAQDVTLTATFQGCQDNGICYPPMTRTVKISLPKGEAVSAADIAAAAIEDAPPARATDAAVVPVGAPLGRDVAATDADSRPRGAPTQSEGVATEASDRADDSGELAEDSRLAASLTGSGRWLALFGFFGAGLLLAFTPCVLPMIPILSGLIAGQGTRLGTRRALWLSFIYVLANALVFTVAGVVAALLGANLQVAFQTPWVLVLFALLFVALALSSFGLYELQLPASVRARLGNVAEKQAGGSLAGVAAMGALSALIVGPCVAPPLAAAVLYISQSHDPVFGGLALFVLAMGMGVPLLAFGAAAGRGMPIGGPWMIGVQRVFGFVFLGLAVWMLSRILPGVATLALFGLLALAAAAWALDGTRSENGTLRWFARFAGLVLAVVGAAQLFGALGNATDPLRPLAGFGGSGTHATQELAFRIIKSGEDLDRELAAAQATGTPVMFDFYADWCVSCKEMDKYTFTDPAVQAVLSGFVLLKADVTANDAIDQALMKRFGIIGPPGTLFFVDGAERRPLRLVGFEKAEAFAARAGRAATVP